MSNVIVRFIGDTTSLSRAYTKIGTESAAARAAVQSTASDISASGAATAANAETAAAAAATATRTTSSLSSEIAAFGRSMTLVALPLALIGGYAIKSAVDYEDSINKMMRLADVSSVQAKQWSAEIITLSGQVGQGPKELGDALYYIASSGTAASEAMGILKVSAKAATTGMGSTQEIADALTSVINVYGKDNITAAKAGDILTASVREGKGEASAYAKVVGRILPVAQTLGIRFEDVGGAMSVVTNRGLSAAEAATGIRQAMAAVIKPTKGAKAVLAEAGLTIDDIRKTISERGFLAGMEQMRDAAGGNITAFRELQPNIRGLNAALILTSEDGAAKAHEIFGKVAGSTGALDDAFGKAGETTKVKLAKAFSGLKAIAVDVGLQLLPFFTDVVAGISKVVFWFENMGDTGKKWLMMLLMIPLIVLPLMGIFKIFSVLNTAITGLLSPIGLCLIAGVLLGLGFIWLYDNCVPFRDLVDSIAVSLGGLVANIQENFPKGMAIVKDHVGKTVANIQENFPKGVEVIKQGSTDMKDNFLAGVDTIVAAWNDPNSLSENSSGFVQVMVTLVDMVHNTFNVIMTIFGVFRDLWTRSWTVMSDFVSGTWDGIKDIFKGAWDVVVGIFKWVIGVLTGDWSKAWSGLVGILTGFWGIVVGVIETGWTFIKSIFGAGIAFISWIWGYLWGGIKTVAVAIWGGIWSAISGFCSTIANTVTELVSGIWNWITNVWNNLVDFFTKLPGRVSSAISGLWNGIKDGFKGVMNWIIEKWNNFGFKFPEVDVPWIGKIGGWVFDTPNIPTFHAGGVVDGMPGQEVLALLKVGETVRTVEQERQVQSGQRGSAGQMSQTFANAPSSGGDTFVVHQYFYGQDPREAARQSAEELHWMNKTSGR